MKRRKRTLIPLIRVLLVLVAFIVVNVGRSALRAMTFPRYWRERANEPVAPNAMRVIALGDSIMQAIGAARPEDGIAGRVADYLKEKTGRPVHLTNLSDGGAGVKDVLDHQLPQADLEHSDLILVATASDMERRAALETYRADLNALLQALPADKTIFSDLPIEPGRDAYQAIFQQSADAAGIRRADFVKIFSGEGRRLDIFSWLFPHLNSKGYFYWFLAFKPLVDEVLEAYVDHPASVPVQTGRLTQP